MAGVPKIMLQRLQTLGAQVLNQTDDMIRFITTKGDDIVISYQDSFKGKILPTWKKRAADGTHSYLFHHLLSGDQLGTTIRKIGSDGNTLTVKSLFKYFSDDSAYAGKIQKWESKGIIGRKNPSPYLSNYKYDSFGEFCPKSDGLEHKFWISNPSSNVRKSNIFDFLKS